MEHMHNKLKKYIRINKVEQDKISEWFMFMGNSYMVSEVKWASLSKFWTSTYSLPVKMASQNTQYIQGPKMDWTEDADWHKQFKDWREESEIILYTILLHIRNQETKIKFVSLWDGKEARKYLNTVDQDKKDSLKTILDTLKDWTRPKCNEVAVFTQLRILNQGNKTLSTYIQGVRRVVDLCNFNCVGDCKDRLIRNSIVAGLNSTKAYQQCISKGFSLTLNECIVMSWLISNSTIVDVNICFYFSWIVI